MKKFILFVIIAVMCLSLFACTKEPEQFDTDTKNEDQTFTDSENSLTSDTDEDTTEEGTMPDDTTVSDTVAEEPIDLSWQLDEFYYYKYFYTDSETLAYAPREQDVLPATFVYEGQTITVSKPIFIGLKTDMILSYKANYSFKDGLVLLWDFLIDKTGKLLYVDASLPENVKPDYMEKISTYDSSMFLESKYDESGLYSAQLFTSSGEVLSEEFDCIGYFYNGLALVERDQKIGIIDSKGNTLLEPCIEFDDLRWPPKYKKYHVAYMCEDAFVLPIDGEFAIITITRS